MGWVAIISGRIRVPNLSAAGHGRQWEIVQERNARAIVSLPERDAWPALDRSMFTTPTGRWSGQDHGGHPSEQVVFFGGVYEDILPFTVEDLKWRDDWVAKFESLLRRLYWNRALALMEVFHGGSQLYQWRPSDAAAGGLYLDDPRPSGEWEREVRPFSGWSKDA